MGKIGFKYFLMCMTINLGLAGLEIFTGKCLANFVNIRYTMRVLIYVVLLMIFNPIVTYVLADATDKNFKVE